MHTHEFDTSRLGTSGYVVALRSLPGMTKSAAQAAARTFAATMRREPPTVRRPSGPRPSAVHHLALLVTTDGGW